MSKVNCIPYGQEDKENMNYNNKTGRYKKTHEWESREAKYYIWNKNKLVWLIADYTLQKAGGKNNEIEDIVIETIQNETKRGKRLKNK